MADTRVGTKKIGSRDRAIYRGKEGGQYYKRKGNKVYLSKGKKVSSSKKKRSSSSKKKRSSFRVSRSAARKHFMRTNSISKRMKRFDITHRKKSAKSRSKSGGRVQKYLRNPTKRQYQLWKKNPRNFDISGVDAPLTQKQMRKRSSSTVKYGGKMYVIPSYGRKLFKK